MFKQIDPLLRRIAALEKEVQKLKDDQIKQNRDYKDAMYNLDGDNIPALQGIVKKVNLIIGDDGKIKAQFVMDIVNNESYAKIQADRIDLTGLKLNLTANNITISSKNFNVDKNGNMKCNNAEMENAKIKRSCVLAADLIKGNAMSVCEQYSDGNNNTSDSMLDVEIFGDDSYPEDDGYGNIRNLVFKTRYHRSSNQHPYQDEEGKVVIGPQRNVLYFERSGANGRDEAAVGISRGAGNEIVSFMRVGDTAFWISHQDGMSDEVATTASQILTGQYMPECIQNIITS